MKFMNVPIFRFPEAKQTINGVKRPRLDIFLNLYQHFLDIYIASSLGIFLSSSIVETMQKNGVLEKKGLQKPRRGFVGDQEKMVLGGKNGTWRKKMEVLEIFDSTVLSILFWNLEN